MRRALVICPGRGSYTARSLGYLKRYGHHATDLVARADEAREARGEAPVSTLDAAERFDAAQMMMGSGAAALTFMGTVVDLARLDPEQVEVVCATGNSMGWYTALYAGGALSFDDALEVVLTMGGMQGEGSGSQVLYPLTDDQWRMDSQRLEAVERALEETGAGWSIRLGGVAVLAGTDDQVKALMRPEVLPTVQAGGAGYPKPLGHHAAYHTGLMARVSELGQERLDTLQWSSPEVTLVDGRGALHSPGVTHPDVVRSYTLGHQVVKTFDFTAAVRGALRAFAPDVLLLPGPGQSLGAPVAQVLVEEGWQGIRSRQDFMDRQTSEEPLVIAMDRSDQAALVTRP